MNKIDFLSPPITLFHLEKRTHTSNVGGFLLILMTGLCVYYILFLFYDLMVHKKLTVLFHKRFEFEAGYYSFNSSSIFHFIQIFSPEDGGYFDKFDSKYIRAYTTYVHSNFSYANLGLYDHWVFDTCSEGIDNKGLESYLFDNIENFTNGVCIRYYYNSSEKKYYNLGHEKFSWPYLEHGISQKNNIYLTTIVQKCSNDSVINKIFGVCPPQKEIDDYVSKYFGIYLYFTDVQVDPSNYTNPVQKYLQVISTGIGNSNNYVESYLHFSPLRVKTSIGSIFGKNYDIDSFCFDFNRKGSSDNNEKYFTITKYYHLMQNNVQIYERKYNNVFDILAEIGGLIQFIFYLFYWINYVYNKYIIAFDTNSLFFAVKDNQVKEMNYNQLNNNINNIKINDINLVPNISINNNNPNGQQSKLKQKIRKYSSLQEMSDEKKAKIKILNNNELQDIKSGLKDNEVNLLKRKSENVSIANNNKNYYYLSQINLPKNLNKNHFKQNNKKFLDVDSSALCLKNNNDLTFNKADGRKDNNKNNINNNFLINGNKFPRKESRTKTFNYTSEKDLYNKIYLSKISISKIDHKTLRFKKINNKEKIKSVKNLSFFNYLKYLLFDKKGSTGFLIKFRKHLLSEEHLFKSHIKTILLEKEFNSKKAESTNVFECFNEL